MSRLLPRFTVSSHADQVKIDKIIGTKAQAPIIGYEQPATYRSSRRQQRERIRPELRGYIIERDGAECYLCGKECDESEIHIDHVHPVAKGGDNHPNNLRVACANCNLRKSDRTLDYAPNIPIRAAKPRSTGTAVDHSMQYTDPVGALLHKENLARKKKRR